MPHPFLFKEREYGVKVRSILGAFERNNSLYKCNIDSYDAQKNSRFPYLNDDIGHHDMVLEIL